MSIKIIKEAYRKMVSESPIYVHGMSRDILPIQSNINKINQNHHTSTDFGDNHYHIDNGDGDHYFYHLDSEKKVDSFSKISDGTHELVWKRENTDSDVVTKNFTNALSKLGSITSDNRQSKGSMLFWQNIHEKFPGKKVVALRDDGHEREIKDHDEMKHIANSVLWHPSKGDGIRIKIYDRL